MTPSPSNSLRIVIGYLTPLLLLGLALLALPFPQCARGQGDGPHFYALGSPGQETETNQLYELDKLSLRVLRSLAVGPMRSAILTPNADVIILGGGHRVLRVSTADLKVVSEMTVPSALGVNCVDRPLAVNAKTGLAYFACQWGPGRVIVVDTLRQKVVADISPSAYARAVSGPTSDSTRHTLAKLFASGDLRIQNLRPYWDAKGMAAIDLIFPYVLQLPNGNLLLEPRGLPRRLFVSNSNGEVVRTWDQPQPDRGIDLAELTLSKDRTRLFAILIPSYKQAILLDTSTLQMVRRWTLPESAGGDDGGDGAFVPAPDGHGMWFFGKSGKIYRLNDHTGELLGEVKLPFHLISLIREP
ncbi:MAG: hypothetical protein ACRD4X_00320 [Candidatus Acidiferrales bacterium]